VLGGGFRTAGGPETPWYVPPALEEPVSKHPVRVWGRRTLRGLAGAAIAASALTIAACGASSKTSEKGAPGNYPVRVVTAEFPPKQRLGETSLMRIGVRNAGDRTLPALTVTVSIAGKEGQQSGLPFGIRDPEPGLAQPDRPVWVLSEHYPKLAGSSEPGGAETANEKTFDFGPLDAGATTEAVWKLSAVKTGNFTVLYSIGAGLNGEAKAETANGVRAGGTFAVRISEAPPNTVVTDSGAVVEIPKQQRSR
jgi:hypothetical protein